jgi:Transglutaminase-like superfamily
MSRNLYNNHYQPHPETSRKPHVVFVASLLCSCLAVAQSSTAGPDTKKEIWAECRIAGSQAGYYHEKTEIQNGQMVTSIENDLVFNRMGSKVEMKSTSRSAEAEDGRLLSISSEMSSSAQSTKIDATVTGQSLTIRTSTGGKTYDRTLSFVGELLGPAAARRLTNARLKSAGDTVSYQMFLPELGSLATVTDKFTAREEVAIDGKQMQALKLEQTLSAMPGKADLWLEDDGWLLRQITYSPFGDIETVRTSSQNLQSRELKDATLPDESFKNTLITANIRLPEERLIEQLTIRIHHKKSALGWPDFSADNQRVLEQTADDVILEIRQVDPKKDGERPLQNASSKVMAFLEPNALLQSDDAAVRQIAETVVGNDPDAFRAARSLQKWTNENMHFDLGIAIAPGSEVAKNRRGTCFGYAVLLASLARAEGIPSRIRMGFVYAGGIWGGHAWVEILAGDNWIPLDGALYSPGPADAARVSFFTSGLEEGTIAQVGELAKLFGNVDITILEYTVHGRRVVVPQNAKPFSISEDTYQNPWLGLTLQKPKGFRYTQLDSTWPESTIVAMEGPQNQTIQIRSLSQSLPVDEKEAEQKFLNAADIVGTSRETKLSGYRGTLISSADRAGFAFKQGGEVLVIAAKGAKAAPLLMEVLANLKLRD